MLRTEIINLLAERAEVPQLEAARFMEIFLYKLSELLLEGDRFKLDNLGEFVISSRQKNANAKAASGKIFQFTPAGTSETVTFGVPPAQSANTNPLDDYFSLSITGKFIPVRGETAVVDGLPQSADEMRRFLEQHAGLLLQEGNFLRAQQKKAPVTEEVDDQLSKEAFLPFNQPKEMIAPEILPSPGETSWEFGNDWKKEYEEDILLDAGAEHNAEMDFDFKVTREADDMNWDFGAEEKAQAKEDKIAEQKPPVHEEPKEFDLESFAPVRAMTRELEIDLSEFNESGEEEQVEEEEDYEDDIVPEDFDALFKKSLAENVMNVQLPPPEEIPEEEPVEEEEEPEHEEISVPDGDSQAALDLRGLKLSRHITPEEDMEFNGIRDRIERKSNEPQKSYVGYYILAFLILSISGGLVYTKLYGIPSWADKYFKKKDVEVQLKASPTDIERDYAFPVSYPYERAAVVMVPQPVHDSVATAAAPVQEAPKQEPAKQVPVKQEPVKQVAQQKAPQKAEVPAKDSKSKPEQKNQPEQGKKITSSSYRDAFIEPAQGGFEIQVMSLGANDKASAEKAAARLRSYGFHSFVIEKEIPKRGTVNRVRVGPFASRQEAESALRKIKGE